MKRKLQKGVAILSAMAMLFFSSVTNSVALGGYQGTNSSDIAVELEEPTVAFGWAAIGAAVAGAVAVTNLAGAAYDAGTYIGSKLGTTSPQLNEISYIMEVNHDANDFSAFDLQS